MQEGPVLNPALDLGGISKTFARYRRVHIPQILPNAAAVRTHRCLERETDFSLLCRTIDGQTQAWRVAELTPPREAELLNATFASALGRIHALHDGHALSRDGEDYGGSSPYLAAITGFLNSPPVLNLARQITGNPEIALADACATRFRRGHFLNQQDGANDRSRIAGYILDMTPDWRLDWGGPLLFSDRAGHFSEGYMPAFNALDLFAVPQEHLVGFVSPFAGGYRLSVTGWFRSRAP